MTEEEYMATWTVEDHIKIQEDGLRMAWNRLTKIEVKLKEFEAIMEEVTSTLQDATKLLHQLVLLQPTEGRPS